MRTILLAGLLLWFPLAARAESTNSFSSTRPLSLRESFNLALSRNLDLQIEQLNTDIAGFNLNGAYGVYVPTVSVRAQHDFLNEPADLDPKKSGLDFPYEMQNDTVQPGLNGKLPIGLTYGLTGYTREDNVRTLLGTPPDTLIRNTNNYFSEGRIDLQQHLLRDFWIDSDREQILLRRRDLKISQQAMRFQV